MQKEKNIPILVSLQTAGSSVVEKSLIYPATLVPDSERTRVTVFGKIIVIPFGCFKEKCLKELCLNDFSFKSRIFCQ